MNKKYSREIFKFFFIFFCVFILEQYVGAQPNDYGYKLKTVIIDAGHGGKDPVLQGKKTTEKDVVLGIALKLGNYIESNLEGVKVIYTRKTDVFVELHKRAEIANQSKADLFISIHANGNENHLVSGTESLVLGNHRAGENFEVAKKENAVILLEDNYEEKYEGFDPNSSESYQSFSLMQDLYFKKSVNFAALVQEQFRERAQRKDRSVKQQGLLVLARSAMPGVLIETGFITNPEEEIYLMSEEGQDYLASAIYRAFRDYKEIVESRSSLTASLGNGHSTYIDSAVEETAIADDLSIKPSEEPIVPAIIPIVFKVQIAASSRQVTKGAHAFKGIKDIAEYKVGNIYKYAVGSFQSFQETISYSKQIREIFPDAFVIAVKENKIIPLDQALKESMSISADQ